MNNTLKIKIFIVDDDRMFSHLISSHLHNKFGVKVKSFSTPEECYEYLHEKPDVIFLDYNFEQARAYN